MLPSNSSDEDDRSLTSALSLSIVSSIALSSSCSASIVSTNVSFLLLRKSISSPRSANSLARASTDPTSSSILVSRYATSSSCLVASSFSDWILSSFSITFPSRLSVVSFRSFWRESTCSVWRASCSRVDSLLSIVSCSFSITFSSSSFELDSASCASFSFSFVSTSSFFAIASSSSSCLIVSPISSFCLPRSFSVSALAVSAARASSNSLRTSLSSAAFSSTSFLCLASSRSTVALAVRASSRSCRSSSSRISSI
mmetsp:Transcript_29299/g.86790  ORF Transcript_29299/g.86790 Transcript_29299/m.86790 type:complete len:256 (+) Transcript_29299:1221-1988(+)